MPKNAYKLSYEGELILRPIIAQLKDLPEGGTMVVSATTPERLWKIRSQVYRHFMLTEQTKHFKVIRDGALQLLIMRRISTAPTVTIIGAANPLKNPKLTETLESILDLPEPEALEAIRHAVEAKQLSDAEALSVMEEYTRVMST